MVHIVEEVDSAADPVDMAVQMVDTAQGVGTVAADLVGTAG